MALRIQRIIMALMLSLLVDRGSFVLGQSKVGTTAANFLTIPVGAQASGMGGAFVAVANDATTAFWNPGGLSRLTGNEVAVCHADWLVGTNLNWLSVVLKFGDHAMAVSVNQLDYGQEEVTTEFAQNGTGEYWDAQDIAVGFSYARNLTDRFSIGGTAKYIQERIWHEQADAFALDVGLLFRTQFNDMRIGMNMANYGTEMQLTGKDLLQPVDIDPAHPGNNENIIAALKTDSWSLPSSFTVGLAMDVIRRQQWLSTLSVDATYPSNNSSYMSFGSELSWNGLAFLRFGYNSVFKEQAEEGLTLGLGIKAPVGSYSIKMDYSYMDMRILSSVSRYSISIAL